MAARSLINFPDPFAWTRRYDPAAAVADDLPAYVATQPIYTTGPRSGPLPAGFDVQRFIADETSSGGGILSVGSPLIEAAELAVPLVVSSFIPEAVAALKVVESGKITPEQAIQLGGSAMAMFNGWGESDVDFGGGEFTLPDDVGFDPGGEFGTPDVYPLPDYSGGSLLRTAARLITDSGDVVGSGGTMRTGVVGAVTGGLVSGGIWLGSYLAKALGRSAGGAIYTAANGIRVRIAQLWPLVRKYGAENVAGALGIGVGALGTLLMQPGARTGVRRKRRGISARDVRTTRRTIHQLRSLTRMAGIKCGGGGYRRPRRSYYRPRYYR